MQILWLEDKPGDLKERFKRLATQAEGWPEPLRLYLSKTVECRSSEDLDGRGAAAMPTNRTELVEFLKKTDVLIIDLDIGEFGGSLTSTMIATNLGEAGVTHPEVSDDDCLRIRQLGGLAFFHAYFQAMKGCQAIFFLTAHDPPGSQGAYAKLLSSYLDPFCKDKPGRQGISRYYKDGHGPARVFDRVSTLITLYAQSYTSFDNLLRIELAASHDEPVMLVGESGTGKEYIARAIHARWVQEKRLQQELGDDARERFAAVNCAMLTEDLGAVELFGALDGAYTGLNDHALGIILHKGCGLVLTGDKDPSKQRIDDLVHRTKGLATSKADLRIVESTENRIKPSPLGTLFLDEFGEMPLALQGLLLRFLESWEVPMRGLPGVVRGGRLRIITATSDPRFAAFAGYSRGPDGKQPLRGQWRTREELARPLRGDLMFRAKGQTIRVDPVTEENVDAVTRRLIETAPRVKGTRVAWEPTAVDHLISRLVNQIREIDKAEKNREIDKAEKTALSAGGSEMVPVFGHKREISGIIRLCEVFVSGAFDRGVRPVPQAVSSDHVDELFTPSLLMMSGTEPGYAQPAVEGPIAQDLRRRSAAIASPGQPPNAQLARRLIEAILQEGLLGREADSPWNWTSLQAVHARLPRALQERLESVLSLDFLKPTPGSRARPRLAPAEESAMALVFGFPPEKVGTDPSRAIKSASDFVRNVRRKRAEPKG